MQHCMNIKIMLDNYYFGRLRLPNTVSREAKMKKVDIVMNQMGLGKCADTQIGGAGNKGISGGERKRVSMYVFNFR